MKVSFDRAMQQEAEISKLREALQEIADMTVPDQPAAKAYIEEAVYVRQHVGKMRARALEALK